jgi:hypothetical protein
VILIGCYVPVKDDSFLSSLKNLEAVIPYEEVKNTSSILLNNTSLTKLQSGLAKLKKDKLKAYLSSIG